MVHFRHQWWDGCRRRHPGDEGRDRTSGFALEHLTYEVLAVLWEGPRHGYGVMLAIGERRGLRPAPSSVYPVLRLLEERELVSGRDVGGKRVYTLTPRGSERLADLGERLEADPARYGSVVEHTVSLLERTLGQLSAFLQRGA